MSERGYRRLYIYIRSILDRNEIESEWSRRQECVCFEGNFIILGLVVCGAILRTRTSGKTGDSGQKEIKEK